MNTPTSLTREQNLHNWSQIISECQEAKARGTKVRDWLETRGISNDAYYYWYAEVRKELINSAGSIVPIPETIIKSANDSNAIVTTDVSIPHPQTQTSSFIRIVINDISIEVTNLTNPDTLTNVIKAVRYA